jgi:hypothetical protein
MLHLPGSLKPNTPLGLLECAFHLWEAPERNTDSNFEVAS